MQLFEKETYMTFRPPTVEQVAEYIAERDGTIDPEEFVDFYESKGWYIGKNKMKNWQAAVRTWERRQVKSKAPSQEPWKLAYQRCKQASMNASRFDAEKTREALAHLSIRERHVLKQVKLSRFWETPPEREPGLMGAFKLAWNSSENSVN